MPADKDYQAHYRFCVKLGRRVSWEEYAASPKTGKRYQPGRFGPPGSKANDLLARRHRQYCHWLRKYLTWDEYQAKLKDPKKPRNRDYSASKYSQSPEAIAARVERNRDILRQRGLLAA